MSTSERETYWEEIYLCAGAAEECAPKSAQSSHAPAIQYRSTVAVRVERCRVDLEFKPKEEKGDGGWGKENNLVNTARYSLNVRFR